MGAMLGKIGVEVPKHEVLLKKPLYEIRKYPPFVIVSTSTEDMVEGNNSFGRLARYIGVFGSPENTKNEAISMTAPVVTGLESSVVSAFHSRVSRMPGGRFARTAAQAHLSLLNMYGII